MCCINIIYFNDYGTIRMIQEKYIKNLFGDETIIIEIVQTDVIIFVTAELENFELEKGRVSCNLIHGVSIKNNKIEIGLQVYGLNLLIEKGWFKSNKWN